MGCTASFPGEQEHPLYESAEAFHARYAMEQELGRGGFGQVRAVRSLAEPAQRRPSLAVKVVGLQESPSALASMSLEEDAVWSRVCDHPNVVALHGTFLDSSLETPRASALLLMERCQGPIRQCLALAAEPAVAACAREMLAALEHVHARQVVHRDVKLSNFLLGDDRRIKLGDFGLACALPACGYLRGIVGTPSYMAPEVVASRPYTCAIDMWSYGVCCYQLIFGGHPFKGREPSRSAKRRGLPSPSPAAEAFVQELLQQAPASRPTAAVSLRHAFLEKASAASLRASIVVDATDESLDGSSDAIALRKHGSETSLSTCAKSERSAWDESSLTSTSAAEAEAESWAQERDMAI